MKEETKAKKAEPPLKMKLEDKLKETLGPMAGLIGADGLPDNEMMKTMFENPMVQGVLQNTELMQSLIQDNPMI